VRWSRAELGPEGDGDVVDLVTPYASFVLEGGCVVQALLSLGHGHCR
jgi:hypothetical protein